MTGFPKYSLLAFLCLLIAWGCEDVVELEIPAEEPRLIVDALLRVDIDEPYIPVRIKFSTTSNFFSSTQVASPERVIIILEEFENGNVVSSNVKNLAEETPGSGIYVPDPNFSSDQRISTQILENDVLFTLLIQFNGRDYAAQTRYVPSVAIDSIVQGTETLFDEEDTEAIVTFTDAPDRDDYYLFDFSFGDYLVTEDTFYKGQQFSFSWFYDQQFNPGTQIPISLLGADQEFYNYMNLLIQQSDDIPDVFSTPVATLRGNVFDVTGLDNINIIDNVDRPDEFALGYFALVQEYKDSLLIQ